MLLLSRSWIVMGAAGLSLAWTGCQPKAAEKPADKKPAAARPDAPSERPASQPDAKGEHKVAAHKSKLQVPPPPPTIPKVTLSDELRAACIVSAGDAMPEGELVGPDGKMHALNSLYGQKLTVVCLWTIGTTHRAQLVATAALQDLSKEVASPFGKKGVNVVGVNVGDASAAVGQTLGKADAKFSNLLDPEGEFFARLAKDKKMPRVYLLDAEGRILWFDVEFRRNSREDLVQSIRVALGEL
jgi:hypothetical protein